MLVQGYIVRKRYSDDRDDFTNAYFSKFVRSSKIDADDSTCCEVEYLPFVLGDSKSDKELHRMWVNSTRTNMPRVFASLSDAQATAKLACKLDCGDSGNSSLIGHSRLEIVAVMYEGYEVSPELIQLEGPLGWWIQG